MNGRTLRVADLPTQPKGTSSPEWWGVFFLVVIEGVVFIGMVASYVHLRIRNPAFPLGGIEVPELGLATVNTVILMLTAVPVYFGVRDIRKGSNRVLLRGLPVAVLMLLVFIALKLVEYVPKPWGATTNAYGSIVMLMTGLHLTHVLVVVLKTTVLYTYLITGRIEPARPAPIEANAVYWYFVILIWLPLYGCIYLSPRLFP